MKYFKMVYDVMNYKIREIYKSEYNLLENFLYEAIFIPTNAEIPPKSIIEKPELQIYIKEFGKYYDDKCLVAEVENNIIGAVWTRIINDYGHIDDETPSLAISLYKNFRNQGIGTNLMIKMIELLQKSGYSGVSLSVQKENYALKLYKKLGFKILIDNDEEYIMKLSFI